MAEVFQRLPTASLRVLAASLRQGVLAERISHAAVQQIAGGDAAAVEAALRDLISAGMGPVQMAVVFDAIADARDAQPDPAALFDLVLSGPDVPGLPTSDTRAVVRSLIAQADREVLLVTYAIHDGARLFEPLARRMGAVPELRVTLCVHIGRPPGDPSPDSQIVGRFAAEFRARHWPWPALPRVFYDPRSLLAAADQRASLHAKCIAVDRRLALITSANFTEAAQGRNIEAGVLVRHAPTVQRLVAYFEGLRAQGQLVECALPG
jgi:phosphatidylserine/phosphatidylglycerophosphate/cardiolipin synthase-like enzyme